METSGIDVLVIVYQKRSEKYPGISYASLIFLKRRVTVQTPIDSLEKFEAAPHSPTPLNP